METELIQIQDIKKLFNTIQQTSASHVKNSILLQKSIDRFGDKMLTEIFKCLRHAFSVPFKDKNLFLERIIDFTALVVNSLRQSETSETDSFIHKIFDFLLQMSNSSVDSYRFWTCVLYTSIFQHFEEFPQDLFEMIVESVAEKLQDTKAMIRCQAILAIHRFQDPQDNSDPVITNFCNLLGSDSNAKVRQLCLEKIALNKTVLPHVLTRILDVDPKVSFIAFQKLKAAAKFLKISERRQVLQCGLLHSSEKIKKSVSTDLLNEWLSIYKDDIFMLMKSIRFDATEEDIRETVELTEMVLNSIFNWTPLEKIISFIEINDEKCFEYSKLNWETILYYRIAVQHLRKTDNFDELINSVLPELPVFCDYIEGYSKFAKDNNGIGLLEYNFTLQQFFIITNDYDVSDSANRQRLTSLVHFILQNENLTTDSYELLLANLDNTITNLSDRTRYVCEIISNIAYGENQIDYEEVARKESERKLQISQIHFDINSLHDKEAYFVYTERNLVEAQRCKNEIEQKKVLLEELKAGEKPPPEQVEMKTDIATIKKCLIISEALLRSPKIKKFNQFISMLNSEIISKALIHDDGEVRLLALRCYGLCCIIDERTARYGIHLFSGILFRFDTDLFTIEVLINSIGLIVDLLSIYGLALVDKMENENGEIENEVKVFVGGTSLTDLLQAFANYLDHEDIQVQIIATQGICVLLSYGRITSTQLLSRILIKWANPATENNFIKQIIGYTLNELTKAPNSEIFFPGAIIATLHTLAYAPSNSPLADIERDHFIKFMLTLCQMSVRGPEINTTLALDLCYRMYGKPRAKVNLLFSKFLALLTLPECSSCDELLAICEDLAEAISDAQILKNITKFSTHLQKKFETEDIPENVEEEVE